VGNPDSEATFPFGEDGKPLTFGGMEVTTRLEEGPLREITSRTKGTYVSLRDGMYPLGALFETQIVRGGDREFSEDALPQYQQRYVWFLVPAFVLLALSSAVGDGRRWTNGGVKP
jgi:hypothetical protein